VITEKVYSNIKVIMTTVMVMASYALFGADIDSDSFKEEMDRMSLEEKVGQLIWIGVTDHTRDLQGLVNKFHPAGISIQSSNPSNIKKWSDICRAYDGKSPILVDADISSIDDLTLFPNYLTLQNISDENLIQQYHSATTEQMHNLGIDRTKHYGFDLNIKLTKITGHSEILKKALFESDGIIISGDPSYWFGQIYKMVRTGEIPRSFFEAKVEKILKCKNELEITLPNFFAGDQDYLLSYQLNNGNDKNLAEKLYQYSFVQLKDVKRNTPIKELNGKNFRHISNNLDNNTFSEYINLYYPIKTQRLSSIRNININETKDFDKILLELQGIITPQDLDILLKLDSEVELIITYFGDEYEVNKLSSLSSVLWHPENNEITRSIAPQILFGGLSIDPVEKNPIRLGYTNPEAAGLDSRTLHQIDGLVQELINIGAAPGCQVLVARKGKIVYNKSFGSTFYDKDIPVNSETLYDLASITKVLGTLPAIMYLDQVDLLDLDKKASDYLPELRGTNKEYVVIRDILTHQAGLYPYLPFWRQTVNEDGPIPELYSQEQESEDWELVSNGLYSNESMQDSLWKWTIESKMRVAPRDGKGYDYKYSDLGFYIMKELVERVSGIKLDQFTKKYLYNPMGLHHLTFKPSPKFEMDKIAPTEYDTYFRKDLIHGTVHDQTAAMFGGVAGHAGLFGNTNDLAKIMQMFLWNGKYGDEHFFHEEIIQKYSSKQNADNRRGLGWDKPDPQEEGNTSTYASFSSFGHTGFTGTSIWADPEYELIYVFLSNRVHPNANNNRLGRNNFRIRIQEVVYRSIQEYEKSHSF
jgi:CubicO group peptidase (beta-lactamase class C family)